MQGEVRLRMMPRSPYTGCSCEAGQWGPECRSKRLKRQEYVPFRLSFFDSPLHIGQVPTYCKSCVQVTVFNKWALNRRSLCLYCYFLGNLAILAVLKSYPCR